MPSHFTSCSHSRPGGHVGRPWWRASGAWSILPIAVTDDCRGTSDGRRRRLDGRSAHACDLEGRGVLRAGQRAGEAVLRHRVATTSRSVRCTPRTAAGSSTSASARSTARRSPTPTSPRATRPRTARWSSSPTTTWPSCPSSSQSREIAVEKFVPSDQIDPMLLREVLLPRAGEDRRQALRPAAPGAARRRPDGRGDGRAPQRTIDRGAAGARRRDRAADDDVARRDPARPTSRSRPARSRPAEVKMANMLVETLAGDFDAERVRGRLRRGRRGAGQGQDRGRRGQEDARASTKSSGEVVDLLAALQRSVDAAKTARGERPTGRARRGEKPAKKAAAKKAAAARRRPPAKKTAGEAASQEGGPPAEEPRSRPAELTGSPPASRRAGPLLCRSAAARSH